MAQPTRKLSPEHREKLAERLAQHRQQKSIISSKSHTALQKSQHKTSSVGKTIARQKKVVKRG